MDKLYKPHFLSQLKAYMAADLPGFVAHKLPPVGHALRAQFSGSTLYLQQRSNARCVWLNWLPGDGVEREFYAYLGWSLSAEVFPANQSGDMRIYHLRGPSADMPCGLLNVQQLEGRQVIRGFVIPTPWDQLYALSPRAPDAERKRVMNKAYAEYLAVTEAERIEAVRQAMHEASKTLQSVLPSFVQQLDSLPAST